MGQKSPQLGFPARSHAENVGFDSFAAQRRENVTKTILFQVGELIIAIQPDIPKSKAEANRWIIGFSEVSKCPIFEETNHHLWMGIAVNFGPPKSQWV